MDAKRERDTQRRVLVVDDEEAVRRSWDRYLSDAGFDVHTAQDGVNAMRALRQETVDVVVSDLKMPGASGVELLEWLHQRHPATPFIMLTGFGSKAVERRVRELGAFEYLEKPVSPEALSMVITAALMPDGTGLQEEAGSEVERARSPEVGAEIGPALVTPMAVEVEAATEPAPEAEAVPESRESPHGRIRTSLEVAGWLLAAPILGLAFVVFLPVIGFGALVWTLAEMVLKTTPPSTA